MPRQSNFELLRIIATMLILAVHMNYYVLGVPTADELVANPVGTSTRCLLESICLICVNLFIFISGWFGIKLRREKLLSFLFQIAWFSIGLCLLEFAAGFNADSLHSIKTLLTMKTLYWFIPAYILLFILSPILNLFTRTSDRNTFTTVIIGFFLIQTWSGWFAFSEDFNGGYSAISFIGIYLLAQYIRRFEIYRWFTLRRSITIFVVCILLNTVFGLLCIHTNRYIGHQMSYINPLTIIATVSFAMIFVHIYVVSSAINFIAASAFAVYLLHAHPAITNWYKSLAGNIYNDFSGPSVIALDFLACLAWFGAAVILDQPRKWLWTLIRRNYFKQSNLAAY